MQFNGIGNEHSAEMHHVTSCMHDHAHNNKPEGAAGATAAMQAQAMEALKQEPEGQLSLSAWLDRTFANGKKILRGLWNGSETAISGNGGKADEAQIPAQIREESVSQGAGAAGQESRRPDTAAHPHVSQVAAAAAAVTPPGAIQNNPYFSAIESKAAPKETLWQKVRVRFKDIAGQLTGHLPGNALNARAGNSFQAKQERPKEDLRKHSKFREDNLEIDCILTDDSYLLDSYDRKGEYSKLSAKK